MRYPLGDPPLGYTRQVDNENPIPNTLIPDPEAAPPMRTATEAIADDAATARRGIDGGRRPGQPNGST